MHKTTDIAILFFSRSAAREAALKAWTRDPKTDYRLAGELIRKAKEKLHASPFPVYHVDETMQRGGNFAGRLANAFQLIFDKGYDHVIAVGNDCADLNVNWRQVATALRNGKVVLGPDLRGGGYLIGLSKYHEIHAIFDKISWHSERVFEQLKDHFKSVLILGKIRDVNTLRDVHLVDFLHEIFIIFSYKPKPGSLAKLQIPSFVHTSCCLRAPPPLTHS